MVNKKPISEKKTKSELRYSDWMNPVNQFPFQQDVLRDFQVPKITTTDEYRHLKPTIRKALHFALYEYFTKAAKGVSGYDVRRIPTTELSTRFGISKSHILRVAELWRRHFGITGGGVLGGALLKQRAYPREIIKKFWDASTKSKKPLHMKEILTHAAKNGLLMHPRTVANIIEEMNRSNSIKVQLHMDGFKLNQTIAQMKSYMESKGIYGAKSVSTQAHHAKI